MNNSFSFTSDPLFSNDIVDQSISHATPTIVPSLARSSPSIHKKKRRAKHKYISGKPTSKDLIFGNKKPTFPWNDGKNEILHKFANDTRRNEYNALDPHKEKARRNELIQEVLDGIGRSDTGRFLHFDDSVNCWYKLDTAEIKTKVRDALRVRKQYPTERCPRPPQPGDILCGRGGKTNAHENRVFWKIIIPDRLAYQHKDRSNKEERHEMAVTTLRKIQLQLESQNCFFLEEVSKDDWFLSPYANQLEKVKQALRETKQPKWWHQEEENGNAWDGDEDSSYSSFDDAGDEEEPRAPPSSAPNRDTPSASGFKGTDYPLSSQAPRSWTFSSSISTAILDAFSSMETDSGDVMTSRHGSRKTVAMLPQPSPHEPPVQQSLDQSWEDLFDTPNAQSMTSMGPSRDGLSRDAFCMGHSSDKTVSNSTDLATTKNSVDDGLDSCWSQRNNATALTSLLSRISKPSLSIGDSMFILDTFQEDENATVMPGVATGSCYVNREGEQRQRTNWSARYQQCGGSHVATSCYL